MTTARRRRLWSDRLIDEDTVVAGVDEELLINPGDIDEIGKGSTLVRMIISLSIQPLAIVPVSVSTVIMSYGVGLTSPEVTEGTINVGLEGEVPSSGWLWRDRVVVRESAPIPLRLNFDIRSQRKLMYGEPRLFLANDADVGVSFIVRTKGIIRCLYLMS